MRSIDPQSASGRGVRCAAGLLLACLPLSGAAAAGEDADAWLDDTAGQRALAVNEGELEFLDTLPPGRILQTRNRLTLTGDSLADGWVRLDQCQDNLDPVPALEIVYDYRNMRRLQLTSYHGIGRAWVEGASVQLTDVGQDAGICISAGVRLLHPTGAGRYEIRSGPFHRRFLDGYYPLQLDYRLSYPPGLLQVEAVQPAAQPGFSVVEQPGELRIDALFEGRLSIRVGLLAR